jgi:cerevisin
VDNDGDGPNFGLLHGGATLICIKVLSDTGSGLISADAKGVETATNDAASNPSCKASINSASLSLGGSGSVSGVLYDAITAATTNGGLFVAVVAGNDMDDIMELPANTPNVYTAGALDEANARNKYSNFGNHTDFFAPGNNVLFSSNNATNGQVSSVLFHLPYSSLD